MSETRVIILSILLCAFILIGGLLVIKQVRPNVLGTQSASSLLTPNSHQTNKEAKITIVEFSDFACPACKNLYPQMKAIQKEYGDKVNFVYRHFPLPGHKNGFVAAKAAEAAGKQDKFWEMHDLLFENQEVWSEKDNFENIAQDYAIKLGLNAANFKTDYDQVYDSIKEDLDDASNLGVFSTPTVYINGVKIDRPSFQTSREEIDRLLKT